MCFQFARILSEEIPRPGLKGDVIIWGGGGGIKKEGNFAGQHHLACRGGFGQYSAKRFGGGKGGEKRKHKRGRECSYAVLRYCQKFKRIKLFL